MPAVRPALLLLFLTVLSAVLVLGDEKPVARVAPFYTAASVVNAADNQSGLLAANTIGTIYGANLSYSTTAVGANDVQKGSLPMMLGASETTVFINNFAAGLYYVSPTQINFLIPQNQSPGPGTLLVLVDSTEGPAIPVTLGAAAPGLFQLDAQNAVATEADGSLLTAATPAQPGDIVILWATGLGETVNISPESYLEIPVAAASLVAGANLSILLDGVAVDPDAIDYAGVAPGYAGLYQINLTLPLSTGANPEIRLQLDGASSVAGLHLPVGP
jgi:uncharacterized protein (TIGR03437 family)